MILQIPESLYFLMMITIIAAVLFCCCLGEKIKEQFTRKTLWMVFLIGLPLGIVFIIIGIMIIELSWFLLLGAACLIIGMFALPRRHGSYK